MTYLRHFRALLYLSALAAVPAFSQNVELREIPNDQAQQVALFKPAPVCAPLARQLKLDDRIGLNAYVDSNGTVYDTVVSFGNPILVRSVEAAVRQWKFKPFESNGKPVKAIANLVFDLSCKPSKPR